MKQEDLEYIVDYYEGIKTSKTKSDIKKLQSQLFYIKMILARKDYLSAFENNNSESMRAEATELEPRFYKWAEAHGYKKENRGTLTEGRQINSE